MYDQLNWSKLVIYWTVLNESFGAEDIVVQFVMDPKPSVSDRQSSYTFVTLCKKDIPWNILTIYFLTMQGFKNNEYLSEEPQTCQSLHEQLIWYKLDII